MFSLSCEDATCRFLYPCTLTRGKLVFSLLCSSGDLWPCPQTLGAPPAKNHRTKATVVKLCVPVSLQGGLKFQHIAGLYSDLLAVDLKGRLHGWSWQSHLPHSSPHALEGELGLEGEKIRLIAAKVLRASLLTESGKVQWGFTHT